MNACFDYKVLVKTLPINLLISDTLRSILNLQQLDSVNHKDKDFFKINNPPLAESVLPIGIWRGRQDSNSILSTGACDETKTRPGWNAFFADMHVAGTHSAGFE